MPAGCGLGKALDNRISGYYSRARFTFLLGIPLQVASGLVHTINSASGVRAIDKHLTEVDDKSKVIIARFDIGVVLPVHRERGGL